MTTTAAPAALTPRQQEVLDWILWFSQSQGRTPSQKEIATGLFITQQAANYHVKRLALAGRLTQVESTRHGRCKIILTPGGGQ